MVDLVRPQQAQQPLTRREYGGMGVEAGPKAQEAGEGEREAQKSVLNGT